MITKPADLIVQRSTVGPCQITFALLAGPSLPNHRIPRPAAPFVRIVATPWDGTGSNGRRLTDNAIRFWDGDAQVLEGGLTLVRCRGHFAGGTVLHWPQGADGRCALLSGDIVQDRSWVSVMYSYPNLIPLSGLEVRRILHALEPLAFDRVYGAFWGKVVRVNGRSIVDRSGRRYLDRLEF